MKKKLIEKSESIAEPTIQYDDITTDQLSEIWDRLLEKVAKSNKQLLITNLTITPEVENNSIILFAINEIQHAALENNRDEILKFIKELTSKNHLKLELRIDKSKADQIKNKTPYTPQEKYNHMIERNPLIKEMKERLNLELDF